MYQVGKRNSGTAHQIKRLQRQWFLCQHGNWVSADPKIRSGFPKQAALLRSQRRIAEISHNVRRPKTKSHAGTGRCAKPSATVGSPRRLRVRLAQPIFKEIYSGTPSTVACCSACAARGEMSRSNVMRVCLLVSWLIVHNDTKTWPRSIGERVPKNVAYTA
jgi:hypothetical protein